MRDNSYKLVGMMAYYMNTTPQCYISHIGIQDEYKHKGYLGKLLALLFTKARQRDFPIIKLEVDKNNSIAIKAYLSYGFVKTGDSQRPGHHMMEYNIHS